ncbi:hypothetical protein [uncultured Roseobacter sp.]|uniref:hypothetical protein n=1 Tax=uncultured Roseobacter sp. TaxID=114847 RepID=UPI002617F42A|nr:hypothetical protein [uncultured Roseobacter sp.]
MLLQIGSIVAPRELITVREIPRFVARDFEFAHIDGRQQDCRITGHRIRASFDGQIVPTRAYPGVDL